MNIKQYLYALIFCISASSLGAAQQVAAPAPQPGSISGTVVDVNDDIVPGATVVLGSAAPAESRRVVAKDDGSFEFDGLRPGTPYNVTITATGFVSWASPSIVLNPGQYFFLTGSKLQIAGGATSVTVYSSPAEIAVEQVKVEEQQRVLGFVPNFYVVYDHEPATHDQAEVLARSQS